jgi:NAD(P)-dependent dehydrogenase (short-subunit alcohol dehydrogenase family)
VDNPAVSELEGRVALVTGASGGIGGRIAARVGIGGRHVPALRAASIV